MAHDPPDAARILDQAANWLVRLSSGTASPADHAACRRWQAQSPAHAEAWAHAEQLLGKLEILPPTLAMASLDRPASPSRRACLATLLALLPAGWASWQLYRASPLQADYHTAVGEQRSLQLADGSRLTLNTDSRLNVRFSATERLLELTSGEIMIDTAPDPTPGGRPFRVATRDGRLEALGTRFSVRQNADFSQVAVLEGAVRIEPHAGTATQIAHAGEQAHFAADQVAPVQPLDMASVAWLQGMLLADKLRLDALAAELARYRRGIVQCSEAVAGLRVSGAFPVGSEAATERSLGMLVSTYPLRAEQRLGGLWVSLQAP